MNLQSVNCRDCEKYSDRCEFDDWCVGVEIIDAVIWLNPLATNLAFNLMIRACSSFLCLNPNLLVTIWRSRGRGTRSHVWFLISDSYSSRMAFSHCFPSVG